MVLSLVLPYYVFLSVPQINSREKWVQGYKYVEDILALIPEEYDAHEREGSYNFAAMSALGDSPLESEVARKYLAGGDLDA